MSGNFTAVVELAKRPEELSAKSCLMAYFVLTNVC